MALEDLGNQIIVKRNNSLSAEGKLKIITILFLIILILTISFLHIGAWLVLPFAGLELVAFMYAFYIIHLHAEDYETIVINDEIVSVERKINQSFSSVSFKRYWANVTLRDADSARGYQSKKAIFVGSHGKEVEFGKDLMSDTQRAQVAHLIKQKIKNINQ